MSNEIKIDNYVYNVKDKLPTASKIYESLLIIDETGNTTLRTDKDTIISISVKHCYGIVIGRVDFYNVRCLNFDETNSTSRIDGVRRVNWRMCINRNSDGVYVDEWLEFLSLIHDGPITSKFVTYITEV